MDEFREPIRAFLIEAFKGHDLADDEDIFATGHVNSMFAMELITFLEGSFGITIDNDDLELENFSTIDRLSELVDRKLTRVA